MSCTKGVGCNGCKTCTLNVQLFRNKQMSLAVAARVAKYVCGKLVVQNVLVQEVARYVHQTLVVQKVLLAVV